MMARFLLANKTDIRSGDLKRFITKCLDNELEDRGIIVGVDWDEDKDTANISGYSFEGMTIIQLVIPRRWRSTPSTIQDLASVFLHELGHTYGLDEHEIPPLSRLDTRWAMGLQLRRRRKR